MDSRLPSERLAKKRITIWLYEVDIEEAKRQAEGLEDGYQRIIRKAVHRGLKKTTRMR